MVIFSLGGFQVMVKFFYQFHVQIDTLQLYENCYKITYNFKVSKNLSMSKILYLQQSDNTDIRE